VQALAENSFRDTPLTSLRPTSARMSTGPRVKAMIELILRFQFRPGIRINSERSDLGRKRSRVMMIPASLRTVEKTCNSNPWICGRPLSDHLTRCARPLDQH
jgi:hypothetical protein